MMPTTARESGPLGGHAGWRIGGPGIRGSRKNRKSVSDRRASQVHQVPQIGFPQMGPVVSTTRTRTRFRLLPKSQRSGRSAGRPTRDRGCWRDRSEPTAGERTPRRWRMDVEDLLSQSLPDLGRGKSLGEDHHDGQRQEGSPALCASHGGSGFGPGWDRRSFVYTAENRSSETVINATS